MKRIGMMLVVMPLFCGCSMLADVMKSQPSPSVRLAGVSFSGITLTQATVNFDVAVTNNYSVPLPVANVGYSLASGGQAFLSGNADMQTTIAVGETKTLRLPATLSYVQVLSVVKGVKPGAVLPYDAKLDVSVDVPVAGRVSVPLTKSGQLPVPSVPSVEVTGISWQELSLSKATAVVDVKVGNTSSYAMNLEQLAGALTLGGTPVANVGAGAGPSLKPGEAGTVRIPISVSAESLGLSLLRVLSGNSADYKLTGNVNVGTAFGPMAMPYEKAGKVGFSH